MDAQAGLEGVRFAVVDLETSGLKPHRHHILQMAVVTVAADGTELDRWVTYVRPARWPFARVGPRHIHGIKRSKVRRAPPINEALAELAPRLEGTVFTAHNAAFDLGFLRRAAARAGVALPPMDELCTLTVSRSLDPGYEHSHRLGEVCRRYGIHLDRPHDALADAEATSAVLPYLLKDAGITRLEDVVGARRPARSPGYEQ